MNWILENCIAAVVGLAVMIAIVGAVHAAKFVAMQVPYIGHFLGVIAIVIVVGTSWIFGTHIMDLVREML